MAEPLKNYFGENLARLLADKIRVVHPEFPDRKFLKDVRRNVDTLELKDRVRLISDALHAHLPQRYPDAMRLLTQIMGPVNPYETGMFKIYYWLMPVGQFIQDYGLQHPAVSLRAIGALTQRNTGEYAIRPFVIRYPDRCIAQMTAWSTADSFHLRRLSSEGLRPRLPWSPRLDLFVEHHEPVFTILENLREDPIRFVQKSVANHLNDYLKVHPAAARKVIARWSRSSNVHTQWIVRHATRNDRKG